MYVCACTHSLLVFMRTSYSVLLGLNSLVPGRCGSNSKSVIAEHMLWVKFMRTSFEITLMWMPHINVGDKSTSIHGTVDAARQQTITWAKIDVDLCRYIASLCYNGLRYGPRSVASISVHEFLTFEFGILILFPNFKSIENNMFTRIKHELLDINEWMLFFQAAQMRKIFYCLWMWGKICVYAHSVAILSESHGHWYSLHPFATLKMSTG